MINYILLCPPVALVVSFILIWLFSKLTMGLAPKITKHTKNKLSPYACGEDYKEHKIEPDYKTFFPFAIFFTVMHVAGLTIATVAGAQISGVMAAVAVIYVAGVFSVLAILYGE